MKRLAEMTAAQLVRLAERHAAGELSDELFEASAVSILVRAQARGVAVADVAAAAEVGAMRGTVLATLGLDVREDAAEHAREELRAARARPEWEADPATAATVLASAVTLAAVQEATQRAYREHRVGYWTRVVESGACEVCTDLRDGVMPASAEPWFHRGCGCSTRPID